MWTYIFVAIGVTLVTMLFLYIDSRLFDKPKKKSTYIKVIIMNVIIVLAIMYILTWLSPTSHFKDIVQAGGEMSKIDGTVVELTDIGEHMLSGPAPF